jgi:ABC-type phosphate transport system substrate-binding protein
MAKHRKQSSRLVAKAATAGLFAAGLLLGAPAGIASADALSDATAQTSETVQKAVVAGSQTVQQATVAGSQTYQQGVVAGSSTIQKAGTATSSTLSSALKGLFSFGK